jgi:hypothetical protein
MNLLEIFTDIIKEECDNAKNYKIFGTQDFHIESIEKIEDKDGAFCFKVTTWNEVPANFDDSSRKVKEMSLFEIMDLLGRIIGHRGCNKAVDVLR